MFYNFPFDLISNLSITKFDECIKKCNGMYLMDIKGSSFREEIRILVDYDVMNVDKEDKLYLRKSIYYEDMIKDLFS